MIRRLMHSQGFKRVSKLGLGIALIGLFGFGVIRNFFALEWSDWKNRWELGRAGVSVEDQLGPFSSLYRDGCGGTAKLSHPGAPNCTCLVLIHGAGDQALTWKRVLLEPSSSWVHPVRLWAIDLPGSGFTRMEEFSGDSLRARRLGRRLGEAMLSDPRASSCTSWGIVGNSFGGWVAAWTQLEHPRRFQKLLLVDSTGLDGQIRKWLEPMDAGASPESNTQSWFDGSIEGLKEFQKRAYFKPRDLPDAVWRQAAARMKKGSSSRLRAAQRREDALDTYLPSLRAQSFVFWGKEDRVTPLEEGRELARKIPGAILREAPECGHLPQKECPKALIGVLNDLVFYGKM